MHFGKSFQPMNELSGNKVPTAYKSELTTKSKIRKCYTLSSSTAVFFLSRM